MKQRFYLDKRYAEILAAKASGAGVSEDIYLNHLITQDFICGGAPRTDPAPPPEAEMTEDSISLSGQWTDLQL